MKKSSEIPETLAKLQRIKGSPDDRRLNLELLNEQRRLADDFCVFLQVALHRGFRVELIAVVDGQTSISSVIANANGESGFRLLREILTVANHERAKIISQIEGFEMLPDKKDARKSPKKRA